MTNESQPQSLDIKHASEHELDDLQLSILRGETVNLTSLEVGVVCLYGSEIKKQPRILKNYVNVDSQLKNCEGEPILIIKTIGTKTFKTNKKLVPKLHFKNYFLTVGLINGPDLLFDFDHKEASLPTSEYVISSADDADNLITYRGRGNIVVDSNKYGDPYDLHLGLELNKPLRLRSKKENRVLVPDNPLMLQVIIGNKGLNAWLGQDERPNPFKANILSQFVDLAKIIGLQSIESTYDYYNHYLNRAEEHKNPK